MLLATVLQAAQEVLAINLRGNEVLLPIALREEAPQAVRALLEQ